ncbi:hypothetical protein [uncultured Fusobacterium sp.]|uniref:hypothetical protein n=1 Tax=uncultured Fusobacterium sp. TaxID=159267 RepID=UPI0025DBAC85|nr:hypothetical protein [uncultured Fusobacterium sp.]
MFFLNARNNKRLKKARKIYIKKKNKFKKREKNYIIKIDISELKNKISNFSEVLNFLKQEKFYSNDFKFGQKDVIIKLPRIFSLIENPDKVFQILKQLIECFVKGIKNIEFDYSEVEELEIGAVALKNIICLNLDKQDFVLSGNFPGCKDLDENNLIKNKYKKALEILIYSGLFKILGFEPKRYVEIVGNSEPLTLPLMGGGKNLPNIKCKSIKLGKIEHQITEYFNNALIKTVDKKLNEKGLRIFDKIIGEVIANCQEHSGEFNQYFCSGHFVQIDRNIGNYQLTIFNFGQSIATGLRMSKHLPEDVNIKMQNLIKLHTKKRWFSCNNWNEETLLTLFSLQDRVSRVFDPKKQRGTGTIRMLKAFQDVGGCYIEGQDPKMTIISGQAQILVDNSEICQLKDKKITFNVEKSLKVKPDENYVKKINHCFPGTIITLNIFLDKKWLENKLNEVK